MSPRPRVRARRIAARFGLSGLQGLDFVRDEEGLPHLIEINPRATQICHLALGSDLPAALLGVPPRSAATTKRHPSRVRHRTALDAQGKLQFSTPEMGVVNIPLKLVAVLQSAENKTPKGLKPFPNSRGRAARRRSSADKFTSGTNVNYSSALTALNQAAG